MTDRLERETIILISRADLDEGFFLVETTDPVHARRLTQRLKGLPLVITNDRLGHPAHWAWSVPKNRLSANFGIRSRSPRPKPPVDPVTTSE